MVLPVLPVEDVAQTMDYYINVLGFAEILRMPGQDGKLVSGQVHHQDAHFMFNLNPKMADQAGGGVYFWVRIDNEDIDAHFSTLKEKGVAIVDEIQDQFWGDRSFTIKDLNNYTLVFTKRINSGIDQSHWSNEHGKTDQSFDQVYKK